MFFLERSVVWIVHHFLGCDSLAMTSSHSACVTHAADGACVLEFTSLVARSVMDKTFDIAVSVS